MVSGLVGIDSLLVQEAVGAAELTVEVVFEGDGNRVSETIGSTTTKYFIDDLNPTGYAQILDELTVGSRN